MREEDRVRAVTSDEVNRERDAEAMARLLADEGRTSAEIERRIVELEREWDIERVLALNAASLALGGVALAAVHSRRWLAVPGVVLSFLIQHALHGWCPPIPLFRHLGVRTRKEIDEEKYALKAIRGDFAALGTDPSASAARAAVRA